MVRLGIRPPLNFFSELFLDSYGVDGTECACPYTVLSLALWWIGEPWQPGLAGIGSYLPQDRLAASEKLRKQQAAGPK